MSIPSPDARSTRRQFLQTAGAGVFACGAAPALMGAEDKAGTRNAVIGEGDFRYECLHNWGEVPEHIRWRNTHGVTIDRDGFIYIKHQGRPGEQMDTIAVFDPDGSFVRSFGAEYCGGGHGIDIREEDGQEFLYLSDIHNRQVVKCDTAGEWVWKLRYPREPDVYEDLSGFRPTNVCFAPDGGFYVGDGYGSHFIHQYDAEARWIRTWGGAGEQPGKMRTPHGQWLDDRPGRDPAIVVADRANARLQYFTLDGEHLSFLEDFSFPADIDIQGEIMLVPDLHARVTLLDIDNNVIAHLGYEQSWTDAVLADGLRMRTQPDRWEAGRFVHPHDACFDREGNLFITEWVETGRVTKLRRV